MIEADDPQINIEHYRELLKREKTAKRRAVIRRLLIEAHATLKSVKPADTAD